MGEKSGFYAVDPRGNEKRRNVETPVSQLRRAFMEYEEAEHIRKWSPGIDWDQTRRWKLEKICAEKWEMFEKLLVDAASRKT